MNLHFIHGFLGLASDWELFFKSFFNQTIYSHQIEDFLPTKKTNVSSYFSYWVQNFNTTVFSNRDCSTKKNILIAYSLGGRLALHCLIETNNWDGAIIISTNPGLNLEPEKESRIKTDAIWAKRFLKENWNSVINDWNKQSVFFGQKNLLLRQEAHYDRKKIALILNKFSLAKQNNLRYNIRKLSIPILWLSGELDTKFATIAKEITSINPKIKSLIIPQVGHRIPWECPELFVSLAKDFINSIL